LGSGEASKRIYRFFWKEIFGGIAVDQAAGTLSYFAMKTP
jgi:hypothetical protein